MKHLLLTLSITALLLTSCATFKPITIGMSEADFKKEHKKAEMVEATTARTVYREIIQNPGEYAKVRYYYFMNSKLVQMDGGVRPADVTIDQTIRHN